MAGFSRRGGMLPGKTRYGADGQEGVGQEKHGQAEPSIAGQVRHSKTCFVLAR